MALSRGGRAWLAIWLLGVALFVPALTLPFTSDDYWLVAQLEHDPRLPSEPYCFFDGRAAPAGAETRSWWFAPSVSMCFFRPLAGWSLALDHAIGGRRAIGYAATNVALWAALLGVALALLARLGARVEAAPAVGLAAGLLFAIHRAHFDAVGWVAARHQLLSSLLVLTALVAALEYQARGAARHLALALAALGCALAASENGVVAALWILVCAAARQRRSAPPEPAVTAARRSAPPEPAVVAARRREAPVTAAGVARRSVVLAVCAGAALVAYGIFYLRGGYGARLSSLYLDASTPASWPRAMAQAFGGAGIALGLLRSWVAPWWWIAALTVAALGIAAWRSRARGAGLALALLLAAVAPASLGPVCDRSALLASLPAALLLSLLLARAPRWARAVSLAAIAAWFVVSTAGSFVHARAARGREVARAAASELPAGATWAVVADAQDHPTFDLVFARAALGLPVPSRIAPELVPGRGVHRARRVGERAFSVEGDDLLDSAWARMVGRRAPFTAGDELSMPGIVVRVDEVRGGAVTRIVATLDRPLDDPRVALLAWRDGALRPLLLPPDGAAVELRP